MKVAVTGTSGRIGRAIHFAVSKDHQVVGVDRSVSSATSHLGEIDNLDLLVKAFDGVDAVVHTAALHAPHVGIFPDQEFVRINVGGTEHVARAARECGVGTLVFTSTTALFGHAVNNNPAEAAWITEETVPKPKSIYHRTKLEAEAFLQSEAGVDLKVTTLRMSRCFPESAPLMAAYRLHRGIDARDVAEAHRLALEQPGDGYRMFIVSGGSPFQPADCVDLKANPSQVFSRRCPQICELFESRGWQLPESVDRVYDASLISQVLGWRPRYGFDDVVRLLDANIAEVLPPETKVKEVSE